MVNDRTYLYSVQRVVCNSSRILNLTLTSLSSWFPSAASAIAFCASAVNRASRWLQRFMTIASIVNPKRLTTSKYEFLQLGCLTLTQVRRHSQRKHILVLHAEIFPEFQLFSEFGGHVDFEIFCLVQEDSVCVPGHGNQG